MFSIVNHLKCAMSLFSCIYIKNILYTHKIMNESIWCWSYIGFILANIALFPAMIIWYITNNNILFSIIYTLLIIFVTGALHEDGLADCADGFGSYRTIKNKITIMKDSNIGTYGSLALILSISLRINFLTNAMEYGLDNAIIMIFFISMISRSTLTIILWFLSPVSNNGMGKNIGRSCIFTIFINYVSTGILICCLTDIIVLYTLFFSSFITAIMIFYLSKNQIGGYTGDILGTTQIISEISAAFTFINVTL